MAQPVLIGPEEDLQAMSLGRYFLETFETSDVAGTLRPAEEEIDPLRASHCFIR